MRSGRRATPTEYWLRLESDGNPDRLLRATAALTGDTGIEEFHAAVSALDDGDYRRFAAAVTGLTSDPMKWFHLVLSRRHRATLVRLAAGHLPRFDKDGQADLLRAILTYLPLDPSDHEVLTATVESSANAYKLAQVYLEYLRERSSDPFLRARLGRIRKPGGWLFS